MEVAKVGRIAWYMKPIGAAKLGIAAGTYQDGFVIESENLPGPSEARCVGNAPFPAVQADLPEEVKTRIADLVRSDYLVVNVISPVIPSGLNEPELTAATFVSRIRLAYEEALIRSKHPHASEIVAGLSRAVGMLQGTTAERGVAELRSIEKMLQDTVDDEWSQTMSDGLTLALSVARKRYGW